MSRTVSVALALVVLAGACSHQLGAGIPTCVEEIRNVPAVVVLQLQAVRDARWGICVEELKVGWEYEAQRTKLGEATFWLSSDRMGDRFAAVTLTTSCDTTGATSSRSPQEGVERFVKVQELPEPVRVVVVPVSPRHIGYATAVMGELSRRTVESRRIAPSLSGSDATPAVQIEEALAAGDFVVVVDDREEASGTLELRVPNEEAEIGIDVDEAVDEIEDRVDDPRYVAQWFHLFPGGCITYDVTASGAGAETVARDLDEVLGFYPLAELREGAAEQGFDV